MSPAGAFPRPAPNAPPLPSGRGRPKRGSGGARAWASGRLTHNIHGIGMSAKPKFTTAAMRFNLALRSETSSGKAPRSRLIHLPGSPG